MARIALLHLPETLIADDKYETKRVSVVTTETTQRDVTPVRRQVGLVYFDFVGRK